MTRRRRSTESSIYAALGTWNDAKAVARGQVPRRIARRVYGRMAGKLAGRLFGRLTDRASTT